MKALSWVFFGFAAYGILIDVYGGTAISLLMGFFVLYADRKFRQLVYRGEYNAEQAPKTLNAAEISNKQGQHKPSD